MVAEAGRISGLLGSFLSAIRIYDQSVVEPADVERALERMARRGDDHAALLASLQSRCEEAEMARDVLLEKERMLLDDRAEVERCLLRELQQEQDKTLRLQEQLEADRDELSQLRREKDQLALRIAQMEDEILKIAAERSVLAERERLREQAPAKPEMMAQTLQGLQGELEAAQLLYQRLCHRHALTCHFYYSDVQQLEQLLTGRARHIAKLKGKLAQCRQQCQELGDANQVIKSHRSKLQKKLRKLWARFHDARRASQAQGAQFEQSAAERELFLEHSQQEASLLQERLMAASGTEVVLREAVVRLEGRLAEAQASQSQSSLTYADLQKRYQEAQAHQAKIEDELAVKTARLEAAQDRLLAMHGHCDQMEGKLQHQEAGMEGLGHALLERRTKIRAAWALMRPAVEMGAKAGRDVAKLRENIAHSITAWSEAILQLRQELTAQVGALEGQLALAKAEVVERDRRIALNKTELCFLEAQMGEITRRRDEALGAVQGQHRDELEAVNGRLKLLLEKQAVLEGERVHLQTENRQLLVQKEALEGLVGDLRGRVQELEEMQEQRQGEMARRIRERDEQIEELGTQLASMREEGQRELARHQTAFEEALWEKERLEAQLQDSMALCNMLRDREAVSRESAETLRQQLEQLEEEKAGLVEAIALLEGQEADWTAERDQLARWLEEQQQDLEQLYAKQQKQQISAVETHLPPVTKQWGADTADLEAMQSQQSAEERDRLMRAMRMTLDGEHRKVLSLWHDLGGRLYRNRLFHRGRK